MPEEEPTVLIVEDEQNLADLYAEWLSTEHDVRTAYDGNEAIDCLDDSVDVVLLDRRMPRLSGDDVLDIIHEMGIDCRIVIVSAVTPDFDIIEMGFDDYLVKPVDKETLSDAVDRMLSRDNYNSNLQEYKRLIAKRAALQAEKNDAELLMNEAYLDLVDRINELEEEFDTTMSEFDETDFQAAFRDLPSDEP